MQTCTSKNDIENTANNSLSSSSCVAQHSGFLPSEYVKGCSVRVLVLKFELWTDWCSWQLSMVNHQGVKGHCLNATLSLIPLLHLHINKNQAKKTSRCALVLFLDFPKNLEF